MFFYYGLASYILCKIIFNYPDYLQEPEFIDNQKNGIKCILENNVAIEDSDVIIEKSEEPKVDKCNDTSIISEQTEIAYLIIRCLAKMEHGIGKNLLAKMLSGSKSKEIVKLKLYNNPHYNSLNNLSKKQILHIIVQLLNNNYLETVPQSNYKLFKPVLAVTKKGKDAVIFEENISLSSEDYSEIVDQEPGNSESHVDDQLYEILRDFRTSVAKDKKILPFSIFHNETLEQIASQKPVTFADLSKIKGIGKAKTELYGEAIIKLIRDYSSPNKEDTIKKQNDNSRTWIKEGLSSLPIETWMKSDSIKRTTCETFNLLNDGYNLSEIANLRGFAQSTIAGHLVKLIVLGKKVDLNSIDLEVSTDKKLKIIESLKINGFDSMHDIKKQVDASITFEEISVVIALILQKNPDILEEVLSLKFPSSLYEQTKNDFEETCLY
jgi:ATP-dependent DNA helicase RecQ